MSRTIHPEPPVARRLVTLLRRVHSGQLLIPRFQRPFQWSDEQRLLLMDSIYRGLPIGSIITWRTRYLELSTYPSLAGVPIPAPSEGVVDEFKTYLLDGHQRLTTLYSALGPGLITSDDPNADARVKEQKGDEPVKALYFDLLGESFVFQPNRGGIPGTWIPLAQLFDRHHLREIEDRALEQPNARELIYRIQNLLEVFSDYEVPVISVSTEELEAATEAFRRINSTGVEINQFHMVNARLWTPEFDLQEHVEDLRKRLEARGWGELPDQMLLNTCKARLDLDVYTADVEVISEKIRSRPEILDDTVRSLIVATDFLREHCGIEGPAVLPYSYQVVLLADAIARAGELEAEAEVRLRRWLWATTYAELFAGMSASRLAETLRHVREVAAGAADPLALVGDQPIAPISRFDFRAARSRALMLRIADRCRPQDPDGKPIDALALLAHEGVRATPMLYSTRELGGVALSSRPENRIICTAADVGRVRQLLDGEPNLFFKGSPEFFESHGLDEGAAEAARAGDRREVLRRRRARFVAIEREHVEQIGLSYADDD
ncbi:MAG: DUF262 domain-containing protein [Myxococcota bacterium]